MNVGSVNSVTFNGRIKETEIGVKYEKSNEGKKYYPLIPLAGLGLHFAINPDSALELFKSTPMPKDKVTAAATVIATAIGVGAIAVGLGAILDAFINKTRRKDANKLAVTSKLDSDTNKGKKVCTAIGAGVAALGLITKHSSFGIKSGNKIITAIITTAGWLGIGAIYDHGVNKFRHKLAEKADNN